MSRLVYRKGADFLGDIIPEICARHPNVDFIIGGDGPKRLLIEEVREKCQLHNRVQMLGTVGHSQVRNVLVKGDIFLNTSLTEAFCIAIVEAACCGLQVVSTSVGGVPEVLPPQLIRLAEPSSAALINELDAAIDDRMNSRVLDAHTAHERVAAMYTWQNVAARTEIVYDNIHDQPEVSLSDRLHRYSHCGVVAGKIFILLAVINHFLLLLVEWIAPRKNIDKAVNCKRLRRFRTLDQM